MKKLLADADEIPFHPVLFPLSVESVAVHDAPPVAAESFKFRYDTDTAPLALDNVARIPEAVLFIVRSLPAVPLAVKLATVVVVLAGNEMVVAPVLP